MDIIINNNGNPVVIVAGNFNQLDTSFLCHDVDPCQIVDRSTHGKNIIDKVFVSISDIHAASVVKSTLTLNIRHPMLSQYWMLEKLLCIVEKVRYMIYEIITLML